MWSSVSLFTLGLVHLFMNYQSVAGVVNVQTGRTAEDLLVPYFEHHGPRHSNRYIRDCQHIKYGNRTHEVFPVNKNTSLPIVDTKIFSKTFSPYSTIASYGHYSIAKDPFRTVSVLEPGGPGGCNTTNPRRDLVETTAGKTCYVATNAGFFNTHNASCLGNIVSDGVLAHDSGGIQNAHFGITHDGYIFTGYLTEKDLETFNFKQLVGGVVWLVRNSESYVNASRYAECSDSEETGSLDSFMNVVSARSAVGHDKDGNVVLVQVDGKSYQSGVDLWNFATFLISLGIVNAINLDGGGSATWVQNGTLANYPSDQCGEFNCARKVSTVLCVHEAECLQCYHGDCINGECHCYDNWMGSACDQLHCGKFNCSRNGLCTSGGCECNAGWHGDSCEIICPTNTYGINCIYQCSCQNGATCNPIDGSCSCTPGYMGKMCDRECSYGFFGNGCRNVCFCKDSCSCHHITGDCNTTMDQSLSLASKCEANNIISSRHLVPDQPEQYKLWLTSFVCLSILAAGSLILNFSFFYFILIRKSKTKEKHKSRLTETLPILHDSESYSDGSL